MGYSSDSTVQSEMRPTYLIRSPLLWLRMGECCLLAHKQAEKLSIKQNKTIFNSLQSSHQDASTSSPLNDVGLSLQNALSYFSRAFSLVEPSFHKLQNLPNPSPSAQTQLQKVIHLRRIILIKLVYTSLRLHDANQAMGFLLQLKSESASITTDFQQLLVDLPPSLAYYVLPYLLETLYKLGRVDDLLALLPNRKTLFNEEHINDVSRQVFNPYESFLPQTRADLSSLSTSLPTQTLHSVAARLAEQEMQSAFNMALPTILMSSDSQADQELAKLSQSFPALPQLFKLQIYHALRKGEKHQALTLLRNQRLGQLSNFSTPTFSFQSQHK